MKTVPAPAHDPPAPRVPGGPPRAALTALHGVLGVSAAAAGQALVRDPSGRALSFDRDWLSGSPFPDYRIPGAFLGIVIAGANLVSAALQWRRRREAPRVSLATGLLLVAWIAIQLRITGVRHWSQPVCAAVFALVTLLAAHQLRALR